MSKICFPLSKMATGLGANSVTTLVRCGISASKVSKVLHGDGLKFSIRSLKAKFVFFAHEEI